MNKYLLLLPLIPAFTCAEVTPVSLPEDGHVQTVRYDADNVIRIRTRLGTSTLIQFEKGETVSDPDAGMGVGDSLAWTMGFRGNNLFLKPKDKAPETNITLVTNKRTYLFNLTTARGKEPTTYILRFTYPKNNEGLGFNQNPYKSSPCSGGVTNTDYVMWGDKSLAPGKAWDNGQFSCFSFPTSQALPAFFEKLPDGSEALLNSHMEGDTLVIHGIPHEYRLRLGKSVLGIKNNNPRLGFYNTTGTSLPGYKRVQLKDNSNG